MTAFAVLAEDRSDAEALVVLIKRIVDKGNISVKSKGFAGCGELRVKAASHVLNFARQGCTHFIICHDSDGDPPDSIRSKVRSSMAGKIDLGEHPHCIVVPVQELEAWIIADEEAITKAIPSLVIAPVARPELLSSPKEWLVKESRRGRSRPLYAPATFNAKVVQHLSIGKVEGKCESFAELTQFVRQHM